MKTASDTAPAARPSVERGADRKQQAAALYASGKSTYEIAPLFGVSAVTIGNWLKALGVPRRAAADHGRQRELEKNPLRAHRSDQGLTRKALAGMVGVSDSAITGIENGHHRPSLQLAQKLAAALEVDLQELFDFCDCACGCGGVVVDQARLGSEARYLSGHNCREPEHGELIARAHRARRARLNIPETKVCERCSRTYSRSEVPNQSLEHWLKRRFCDNECFCPERGEPRVCAVCGGDFIPSYRADESRRCCCGSHGQLYRFKEGNVAPEFVAQMPGRARQRWGGRWAARKKRQRRYDSAKADQALAMLERGKSIRQTAIATGLSKHQVEYLKAEREKVSH